jgi:hypothetical protein
VGHILALVQCSRWWELKPWMGQGGLHPSLDVTLLGRGRYIWVGGEGEGLVLACIQVQGVNRDKQQTG